MNYRVSLIKRFPHSKKPSPILWNGFTLVELLVVIAIMGILIALLAGYSGNSLKSGRKVTAISNLRSISMAAISMASENDGIIDLNDSERGEYKALSTLCGLLVQKGLIDNRSLLISPELSEPRRREFMDPQFQWVLHTFGVVIDPPLNPGYFEPQSSSGAGAPKTGLALRLAAVEKPASCPLLLDTCSDQPVAVPSVNEIHSSRVCNFDQGIKKPKPVLRDGKTLLLSFVDGHAEAAELPRIRDVVRPNFQGTEFTVMGPSGEFIAVP
jgi:prepilin-type N-terminal cleavage/methylation domain-containing protein